MGFRKEPQKRYGKRNVYEELGFNVSPQKKKQPKRIPQWIITTLGLLSAIFGTVVMGLAFGLKGLFAAMITASITTVIALNIKRKK